MKRIFAISVITMFAIGASALTLKEKKKLQEWNEQLASSESHADDVKANCGFEIPVTVDEKMTTPFMEANAHAGSYCESVQTAVADLCKDATSKAEVKSKLKKVVCMLGKKGDKAQFSLSGGTLNAVLSVESTNVEDAAKQFLENNL